jgi:hypothetical protein
MTMNECTHGNTSRFDRIVLGAILVNTVVLGWSWLDHVHELALERVDTGPAPAVLRATSG